MLLGACRLKKRILILVVGLWSGLSFVSCGGSGKASGPPSGLKERVVASQGVTTSIDFGGLYIINAVKDTIPRIAPFTAGTNPGLLASSPTRNLVMAFDSSANIIYAESTLTETSIGNIHIAGATQSMVVPTASPIVYAAMPTATISGFAFQGAVAMADFTRSLLTTIAVTNAQTVVANATGTQILVFSNDSDSITLLTPSLAAPPVDTSCVTNPPNSVCTIVPGFDRPVNAIVNGTTAYVLNCGPQCGGVQASVAVFDLGSLTVTKTIPVDAANMALLSGSTLYVAGTPAATTLNACTGQTTAATVCGRLDIVDLGSGTVTGSAVITDGFFQYMDMTTNGQLFIGSKNCTSIGDVGNPSGEVRGCLSIYKLADGSVLFPPDNGTVNGLQGFVSRNVEYVAEGGALRVYDTTKDILLINDFVPQGTIDIVGYVGGVKAIDFF
jgi:hypothetical protein